MLKLLFTIFSIFIYLQINAQTLTYHLDKVENTKEVLFVFPGFGANAQKTRDSFKIYEKGAVNHLSVVYLDFNRHLFLTEEEKEYLSKEMNTILEQNFSEVNCYLGGFSSGGTITLSLGEYFLTTKSFPLKGVFIVDSPIDLEYLHNVNQKNIERNISTIAVQEGKYINSILEKEVEGLPIYKKYNLFSSADNDISNLSHCIQELPLLIFTEDADDWWKENRGNEFNETNNYVLKLFVTQVHADFKSSQVKLSTSENKGYRLDGKRHPHSWSIVDEKAVLDMIKAERKVEN